MSKEKLTIIEAAYETVRQRRVAGWARGAVPPELEWHPAPEAPDYEVRHGPQGVSDYFDQVLENAIAWEPRITGLHRLGPTPMLLRRKQPPKAGMASPVKSDSAKCGLRR